MGRSAESNRALTCCLIFASAIGAGVVALNLPTQLVQVSRVELSSLRFLEAPANSNPQANIESSGWPLTYRIRSFAPKDALVEGNPANTAGGDHPTGSRSFDFFFSWHKLAFDGFVAILLMALVAGATWARHQHLSYSANASRIRWRYDLATALACLALPLSLYGISYAKAQRHIRLAESLSGIGRVTLKAKVPVWMSNRLPKTFHHAFLRLSDVQVYKPNAAVFQKLAEADTLHRVDIYAASIEATELDFIGRSKTLISLSLINCRISSEAFQRIADHQPLRHLALRGCPVTAQDTLVLDRLPRLELVDLSRTEITLSELDQPGWSKTVKTLRLTRPPRGSEDSLDIAGWKQLTTLHVRRPALNANDSPLTLTIRDCPRLKDLYLDRWQKHILVAKNLPRLVEIHEPLGEIELEYFEPIFPQMSRWQRLELTNLPLIRSLEFHSNDLQSVQLKNVPSLRQVSISNSLGENYAGIPYKAGPALEIGDWLDEVSKIPSIERVLIRDAKMGQAEINRISELPFLKEFRCERTELKDDEIATFARNSSLEILDFGQCSVNQACFNRLASLPKLKSLTADLSLVENFEIQGRPNLQIIATQPFRRLRTLELRQLPRLSSAIVIQDHIEQLRVLHVPNLRELVVECPWPEDSEIEGVDSLLRFAGGGFRLNDRLLKSILRCKKLDQLTLAYPELSPSSLKQISRLTHLTTLEVPGCRVNDSVAASWSTLSRLRRACFDNTQIGAETIRWMSTLESLRSLSLNGVDLRGDAGKELIQVQQLTELSLADANIDPENIIAILEQSGVESIDLSRLKVTQRVLNAIAQSASLEYCVLSGCELSTDQLCDLLARAPSLHVEVHPLDQEESEYASLADTTAPAGMPENHFKELRGRIHGLPLPGSPRRRFGQHRCMIQAHRTPEQRKPEQQKSEQEKRNRLPATLVSRPFAVDLFRDPSVSQKPAMPPTRPPTRPPPRPPTRSATTRK